MTKRACSKLMLIAAGLSATSGALADAALEEILVTAQRREQSLADVPVAVTALDARVIEERGLTDFNNYLSSVPGASFNNIGSLANEVKFRGIGGGNSYVSPTTAVYFGEVPIVHTGRNVTASYNFELVDMERVEVLRGPQGQLYGANSLGGAIKNLPRKADLRQFGVRSMVSGFTTEDGGDSYHVDATLNAPLATDVLAVRLTGYHTTEGGWYDNNFQGGVPLGVLAAFAPPVPGAPGSLLPAIVAMTPGAANYVTPPNIAEDVNETQRDGVRAVMSWQASEALKGDLILAWESMEVEGEQGAQAIPAIPGFIPGTYVVPNTVNPLFSIAYPGTSDYTRFEQALPTTGYVEDEITLANLVLTYDFGGATLTSSTAFWARESIYGSDVSTVGFPTTGIAQAVPIFVRRVDEPEKFIQEVRLQSNGEGAWQWLAGLYYEDLDEDFLLRTTDESGLDILRTEAQLFLPPGAPPLPDDVAYQSGQFVDTQLAAFGELAYQFTPAFTAAASFRWFTIDQESDIVNNGFQFTGQGRSVRESSDEVFTPKLNLSWRPADDQLYYFTAAEGFRTGVVNPELPFSVCGQELAAAGYPDGLPTTEPDKTRNYELGAKLSFADRRATLNAAVYYIDWRDLQAQVLLPSLVQGFSRCQSPAILNVGDAHSQGVELELAAALTERLRVDASFAYTDAEYDDTYFAAGITEGQTIENVPETMGYLGLHYAFDLLGLQSFARAEWNYVGDKEKKGADFVQQAQPVDLGGYSTVGVRAGVNLTASTSLELWADNLFDEDGVTYAADSGGFVPPTVYYIRPRSVGLSVRLNFE